MLNYTSQKDYQLGNLGNTDNYSQAFNNLMRGIGAGIRKYKKDEVANKKKTDEESKVLTSNLLHKYKMDMEPLAGDDELEGNDRLKKVKEIGDAYKQQLEKLQQERGANKYTLQAYKDIDFHNLHSFNQIKKVEKKKFQKKALLDFKNKLDSGVFKTPTDAMEYNKSLKLDIPRDKIIQAFNNAGTDRAKKFIQESTIDGVPTELLRFNSRDDVVRAFYGNIPPKDVDIPQGVISAISSAHKWKVQQSKRGKGGSEGVSDLLWRLQHQAKNDQLNATRTQDSIANSLALLHPVATASQKHKIEETLNSIKDNNQILGFIQGAFEKGKSRAEVETSLSTYRTQSNTDKKALIGRGIDKVNSLLSSEIDKAYSEGDTTKLGQLYDKLYQFDPIEANKKASRDIKSELTTLKLSTLDNLITKLDISITAKEENGQPTPLLDKKFLNELKSLQAMTQAKSIDKKEISEVLNTKKREYIESLRTKNKKYLKVRKALLKEKLTEGWLKNDDFATDRDIQKFLLENPDIPDNQLLEKFNHDTVDIDTTTSILHGGWEMGLSDSLKNGKILIPDDRELGENSISGELKAWIPTHSDKFVESVIAHSKKTLKEIEKDYGGKFEGIDNLHFSFEKDSTGKLHLEVYGKIKGLGSNEMIGLLTHDDLKDILNEEGDYNTTSNGGR